MRRFAAIILKLTNFIAVTVALAFTMTEIGPAGMAAEPADLNMSTTMTHELTLEECLKLAMESSHQRPASLFAVAMAEAQHRQALAGYWPQVNLRGTYQRMDEAPNFVFPASSLDIPAQSIHVPGGTATVTIPAGAFGNPVPIKLPVAYPGQSINTPAQQFAVPKQDVKLMNPDSFMTSMDAKWLLYDGGMRKGFREQSGNWLEMVKQDSRRTDLELIDSVKRLYYGAVMARQVHRVGKDTLARMEATLNLTETMYKEGSGKVKKTDYLDNKVMVESLRSAVAFLEKNEEMAQAALANTMGLSWKESVRPAVSEVPFTPYAGNLETLVATSYRFSPDWAKLESGIRAAEGAVQTAKSGHYPKLAVTGELHKWWNDYDAGMATDQNKEGWSIGVGVEIPIFDGFLTRNKVSETRARVNKIKEQQFLLREGIGLQIKDVFLGMNAAGKSHQATLDAMISARENRDLNTRAYQNELVDTEKVIRAQLVEALMSAQHYKTRYDHIAMQSQLELVVGTEILKQLEMQ
ncbi:MAG: TolC family protein [Pseudomonadota bacterium]